MKPISSLAPLDSNLAEDTLVSLLKHDMVPMALLQQRYGPLLELVRALIGVIPNCDSYLEIWPPAFRTYNVMVPNFLNLPFSLFGIGAAKKELVGLGMYVASRSAECPYCSAHCCSFALRRGIPAKKVAHALFPNDESFTAAEIAIIGVARSLGQIPCTLNEVERKALESALDARQVEWVVFGIAMMGFLNKFMDAIGVELEQPTFSEVAAAMGEGWSPGKSGANLDAAAAPTAAPVADSLWEKLRLVPLFPGALRLDAKWQRGVPDRWPMVGAFLRERTGYDFPVLSRIRERRCIRAIATMLRENLDPETSAVGLRIKALAGVVFATAIADRSLADELGQLAAHHGVSDEELKRAASWVSSPTEERPARNPLEHALLTLALAVSSSPALVTTDIVTTCRENGVSAPAIVEVVSWLSVLQMLHRLTRFYA